MTAAKSDCLTVRWWAWIPAGLPEWASRSAASWTGPEGRACAPGSCCTEPDRRGSPAESIALSPPSAERGRAESGACGTPGGARRGQTEGRVFTAGGNQIIVWSSLYMNIPESGARSSLKAWRKKSRMFTMDCMESSTNSTCNRNRRSVKRAEKPTVLKISPVRGIKNKIKE